MTQQRFKEELQSLARTSNLREIPRDSSGETRLLDFTPNDYLGIASRLDWQKEFLSRLDIAKTPLTAAASRLLASTQTSFNSLEHKLAGLYGRPALLFNSGYHANTGIIPALAGKRTLILADRLVHASIIDGILLSKVDFRRFRHNDFDHLEALIEADKGAHSETLVIVEGIYSMDGDAADIERLIDIKRRHPGIMLYVDEAHSFGVAGTSGLGLVQDTSSPEDVDVVVGTLGKAAASSGAFAIVSDTLRQYLVNKSRSLIFSTALPPICTAWSEFVIDRIIGMDHERRHLGSLASSLAEGLRNSCGINAHPGHIIPVVIGNSSDTIRLSRALRTDFIKVLPIRTPTVPPGTERLRISLSASLSHEDIGRLLSSFTKHYHEISPRPQ